MLSGAVHVAPGLAGSNESRVLVALSVAKFISNTCRLWAKCAPMAASPPKITLAQRPHIWWHICHREVARHLSFKLLAVQIIIDPFLLHQTVVVADLPNGSTIHYDDHIGIPYGAQSMRDNKSSSVFENLV